MSTASVPTQKRKTGDTLRLSGAFDVPFVVDPDWVGAIAVMNITKADDARTPWRTDEPLTLDLISNPKRYSYQGAPPDPADAGDYLYEIEITWADNSVDTCPNDKHGYKLTIINELA